jgi:peptidoglycan/LPS O-acetylase OafA/YrhL
LGDNKLSVLAKKNRFFELEGLRGVAAIMVVVYHFMLIFYGFAVAGKFGPASSQHMRFEDNLYGNPLSAIFSGSFAVAIFFVLSGFVLSIGFFQTRKIQIIQDLAAKRYLRLMLPALVSVIICYLVMKLGLAHVQAVVSITKSGWLDGVWNFPPHLLGALKGALFGIFIDKGNIYNGVLWTMTTEFFGSFIVFGTLLLFAKSKYRWITYAILLLATFNTWYLGFIIGMIFADLHSQKVIQQEKRKVLFILPLLVVAIYLGGYPYAGVDGTAYGIFEPLQRMNLLDIRMAAVTLGASVLIFTILWALQPGRLLRHRRVSILGKYTFSLYLIHIPVLYTLTTGVFIHLQRHMDYNQAAVLSAVLSIPVLFIGTILFERYIDKKAVIFASYCADIFFGRREVRLRHMVARTRVGVADLRQRLMPSPVLEDTSNESE